jgi:hypothetical protein
MKEVLFLFPHPGEDEVGFVALCVTAARPVSRVKGGRLLPQGQRQPAILVRAAVPTRVRLGAKGDHRPVATPGVQLGHRQRRGEGGSNPIAVVAVVADRLECWDYQRGARGEQRLCQRWSARRQPRRQPRAGDLVDIDEQQQLGAHRS